MAIEFTPAQQKVLDARDHNILVSAAAGSGKTAVLTERIYRRITDRKEAIAYAIRHGKPGDIIVLAGKGHEDYQEIRGKKYPMDERELIREVLEEMR